MNRVTVEEEKLKTASNSVAACEKENGVTIIISDTSKLVKLGFFWSLKVA